MPKKTKQTGGLLRGKSHDNGGIPAIVAGKKPIEMEGGEFVSSVSATDAFGKDNYAYINDLGNRDPAAAKKLGKEVKKMAKNGGMVMKNGGLTPSDKEDLPRVKKKIDKHTASQVHGTGGMKPYKPETDSEKRIMNHLKKKRKKSSEWKPKQLPKGFNPMQMKEGGEIEEIARQMGYGGEIEKYGLGSWLKKRVTPSKKAKAWAGGAKKRIGKALDVKGAAKRGLRGIEKGGVWLAGKTGIIPGAKFEGFEQATARNIAEGFGEMASQYSAGKQKSIGGDAYLRALSKTSKAKRKRGVPGQFEGAAPAFAEEYKNIGGMFREGGMVMDQTEISDQYATEDYKAGGCVVTGGTAGDPVAIYNNKKG